MKAFFPLFAVLALTQFLAGCWSVRTFVPGSPSNTRLAWWHVNTLGVVTFEDATYQGVGKETASLFADTLAYETWPKRVRPINTRPPEIGFLDIGQTRRIGRLQQSQALVTGRVMLYSWDENTRVAEIVVAARLLETDRGSIIWSRTVSGRSQSSVFLPPDRNNEFRHATALAAKEFSRDLLAPPVKDPSLSYGG